VKIKSRIKFKFKTNSYFYPVSYNGTIAPFFCMDATLSICFQRHARETKLSLSNTYFTLLIRALSRRYGAPLDISLNVAVFARGDSYTGSPGPLKPGCALVIAINQSSGPPMETHYFSESRNRSCKCLRSPCAPAVDTASR